MDRGAWRATVHRGRHSELDMTEHTHTHVLVREPQVRQILDNRYGILVDRMWIKKHNLDLITSLCYPMQLPLSTWDYLNDN